LLGRPGSKVSRVIILGGPAPVGLAVDGVEALVLVEVGSLQLAQAELAREAGERVRGAFQISGTSDAVKVLDIWPLLEAAFTPPARTGSRAVAATLAAETSTEATSGAGERTPRLVTFDVAGQEFALPLEDVEEIIHLPEGVAAAPRTESVVLGLTAYRDALLPLLSLRNLIGVAPPTDHDGCEKVLVVRVGGAMAGLVVDAMRAIVPADPALVEPTPPMLASRTQGESRIVAIYRGDGGRRLISILSKNQLFREDVMQRLRQASPGSAAPASPEAAESASLQFVVFRLGDEEFALPIGAVEEVARAPDQITRVPRTPEFLEGVINLRGDVLPVVDQRRRFDMPPVTDREARRLLVVRTERHRAGLIVDSVSEVLGSSADAIEPAPALTGEPSRLVDGVINLETTGRLILLLNPDELLTRAERGLLDAFEADAGQAGS
jgi:purine-binding chemotaxis protein CheW